ncbi:MAG: prenyltransferase/squalene oxidase repeat-containing protein [Cyclobacteriaceae bacterium]
MKSLKKIHLAVIVSLIVLAASASLSFRSHYLGETVEGCAPKGCVFLTLMGEESSDSSFVYKTPQQVLFGTQTGLDWLMRAQQQNGGWGAGSHAQQNVMDPHAVPTDPATTAMVAMAMLRNGNSYQHGPYSSQLRKATAYLLKEVEDAPSQSFNITSQTGTQIQVKLGANIDVVLTSQFLSNLLDDHTLDGNAKARVKSALNKCVDKIQRAQDDDGSFQGSGWAGVLQSSFATNALEAAQAKGVAVDDEKLDRARSFQKNNLDAESGNVKTDLGAGVVLYSVSGSTRASAKEARKVREEFDKAKRDGVLPANAPVTEDNLKKIGFAAEEAEKYNEAYQTYQAGKVQSQDEGVMSGFGSNGGEEFLSYLQTGESMIINKDNDWKNWYDNVSGRLLHIQNDDGSWNGHHCITSPVFCTATCLLILSVNNDIERLTNIGRER